MILSDRDVFLAAHVTPKVKEAIREEVRKRRTTISMWVFRLVVRELRKKGYPVTDEVNHE